MLPTVTLSSRDQQLTSAAYSIHQELANPTF